MEELNATPVKDLAQFHGLVGDLFPDLPARDAWEQYRLSAEQVAFFEEHGYLTHIPVLDKTQVEALREELKALMNPSHPGHHLFYEFHSNESSDPDRILFHSLGHWRISPGFHDVLWNPRFVVPAAQLLGCRTVRFWHDQLFCKPARHGGVVAWHQDYSYWTRTTPLQHLTCWVGLDDAHANNGCLQYIPGSHRWELLEKIELAGDMEGLSALLSESQREQYRNRVAVEMPAGFAAFHHPKLVHGSYENRSDSPRRAFVINVFADGTRSASDEVLLTGVPPIPKGQPMQGPFFPVLFETPGSKNQN
ncbi:phytanoyl-CoA dioxygenase family protein [Robiginitalea sp. M366]|uniref:phytanoyl-CoA dioxygenase family protein n=1 Tax=Robiginitalea aestuariiviva TaxID=3036903 RepID=UPI00240E7F59|nr:phytanoyl-CoA dioxygenase family protein [Robiginitalea aestuariiviva]MDG1571924.1 phytanoyl-CoA dioxygenase family protein [Robiginitalea aestuariiviva]